MYLPAQAKTAGIIRTGALGFIGIGREEVRKFPVIHPTAQLSEHNSQLHLVGLPKKCFWQKFHLPCFGGFVQTALSKARRSIAHADASLNARLR